MQRICQVLVTIALLASPSFAVEARREFTKSYSAEPIKDIRLVGNHGTFTVLGKNDIDQIQIHVTIEVEASSKASATKHAAEIDVKMSVNGETLNIGTVLPRTGLFGIFGGNDVTKRHIQVKLTVPQRLRINATTGHGDLTIKDIASVVVKSSHGDVEIVKTASANIKSIHGSVLLTDIPGRNVLDIGHGSLNGERLGAVTGSIGHGKIVLRDQRGTVSLKCRHGHARVVYRDRARSTSITGVHGNIIVAVPEESDVSLGFRSTHGRVSVKGLKHIRNADMTGAVWQTLGDGPVRITMEMDHGTICVNTMQ